jgi:hypothetical protein
MTGADWGWVASVGTAIGGVAVWIARSVAQGETRSLGERVAKLEGHREEDQRERTEVRQDLREIRTRLDAILDRLPPRP